MASLRRSNTVTRGSVYTCAAEHDASSRWRTRKLQRKRFVFFLCKYKDFANLALKKKNRLKLVLVFLEDGDRRAFH